ncbi:MAG TPA: NAD(P)-binding protein [Candidatus Binatia bacterium]|nr:NAD(P)-binding protein [Candidatus Binatia bacterium]
MTRLAIAGAGPAGLAAAIRARERGLDAVVLERRAPPLEKACGEGLMPLGVAALAALGVAVPPERSAPTAPSGAAPGSRGTRAPARFGLRRHFRVAPWAPFVEVHWRAGVEAYVTPVASDEVGVAFLGRTGGRAFAALVADFPALRTRLARATPVTPARGAGPFRQRVRRRARGRVALVGDAAGYVDALTGEGLTLALRGAVALVDTLADGRPLREWERAWRRITLGHRVVTHALLAVARAPRVRARLVRGLAADPALFDRLLAIASGEAPLAALGVGGLLRLGVALGAPAPPPTAS